MPSPQTSATRSLLPRAHFCHALTSATRFLQSRTRWALTGLGLALLVLLVLPSAQIKLGASHLHGLVGSYTGGGQYNVTYSGGTYTVSGGSPTAYSANTSPNAPGAWGGGAFTYIAPGTTASVTCAGQITANFVWDGGPNGVPAPASGSVNVMETATAAWGGPSSTGDCGLPNPTISASAPNQTATRYSTQGGQSFSVNCTPTASMSGSMPAGYQVSGGSAYVGYVAGIGPPPPTITLSGATPDSNGNFNILVGQGCTASLNTPPYTAQQQSGWTWTVSGITFQDWNKSAAANPDASYFLGGSGSLTKSTAHWFWNDPGPSPTPETVTCTATVTPNDGKTAPYTVTATQKITVYLPTWSARGVGGYMQVNSTYQGDPNPELRAGPTATMTANNQPGGMYWEANVYTPPQPAFGAGSLELIQIATPNSSYTNLTPPVQNHPNPNNGNTGLDGTCPYGDVVPETQEPLKDDDNPDIPLVNLGLTGDVVAGSATFGSSYIDYLMYLPPGSDTRPIALAQFSWSTNGSAAIPTMINPNGDWANFAQEHNGSDAAGKVTPSGSSAFIGVTGPDFFPSWTSVVKPKHF